MALVDGLGIRAMIHDPEVDVARARELITGRLAAELGIDPAALRAR